MKLILFLIITLSAVPLAPARSELYFVIWNVGQGQWVTAITPQHCLHFDMGGEFFPWEKISEKCHSRSNSLFLSHWDWDHLGALAKLSKKPKLLPQLCLAVKPLGSGNNRKTTLLQKWSSCTLPIEKQTVNHWQTANAASANGKSHVFMYQDFLIPGDSTQAEEKIWLHQKWISRSRVLILGHHGSQTSTSVALLKNLPSLKMAISSARWARYHHPHSVVEVRLRQAKIPLLRTEDWGNIWLELRPY